MIDGQDEDEDYFTSYILEDFVIYQTPQIVPVWKESVEGASIAAEGKERGVKGQGEYELPSAVYISRRTKNLGSTLIGMTHSSI